LSFEQKSEQKREEKREEKPEEKHAKKHEETHPRSCDWIVGQPELPFLQQQQG
jgi:hypothetical protein